MFGVKPEDGNVHIVGSPLYHTAVLMFASGSMHLGHAVVLMDKWTPEDCLRLIDKYKVTTSHMVPTQFHRLLQLPEDVRAQLRRARRRAPWCTPRRPARPTSSAACSSGGATDLGVLRGDRGRRHDRLAAGVAEEARHRRQGLGERRDQDLRRRGQRAAATGTPGTVYMLRGQADFEYYKDKEKTEQGAPRQVLHRRRHRLPRRRRLPVPLRPQDRHDHLRRRQHLPGRDRDACCSRHPKVGDVAVFGIPHEDWGEEVKAVVEPVEGVGAGRRRSPTRSSRSCKDKPREVQDAEVDRLHRRDAARPERQALQAQAARPVLGRADAEHLSRLRRVGPGARLRPMARTACSAPTERSEQERGPSTRSSCALLPLRRAPGPPRGVEAARSRGR